MAASNLVVRVLTAAVCIPVILALLYLGPAWGFCLVVAFAAGVGAIELFQMSHPNDRIAQALGVCTTLVTYSCLYFFASDARMLVTLVLVLPIVAMLVSLWRLGEIASAGLRIAVSTFGPLYIGGTLAALALLRREQPGFEGPGYVVFALGLAWMSDTGGYFVGRRLGRHKLYPAVSPNKTIEGAVGGLVGALGLALAAHFWFLRSLPLTHAMVLALVAGGLGQLGDLGESLIKRSMGAKDSGAILPGHGGILDRVDAVMVSCAVLYLYTRWR